MEDVQVQDQEEAAEAAAVDFSLAEAPQEPKHLLLDLPRELHPSNQHLNRALAWEEWEVVSCKPWLQALPSELVPRSLTRPCAE